MAIVICGYNNISLIRRPFKKLPTSSGNMANMRIEKLGNFNLIPSDGYYNTENQIFPMNGDDTGTWKIYLISDPDVGILIPHIKKDSNKFVVPYKNIDFDSLHNQVQIEDYISGYRNAVKNDSVNNSSYASTLSYSVSDFIFTQPVFLKSGNNWFVYVPKYKINDDDIEFEKRNITSTFSNLFNVNNSLEINDVVVSNQDIEDMKFTQLAIGKNGLSMKNGLSYTISNTGDVNFNIGNIKSDSTPYMKVNMIVDGTSQTISKKLETDSYRKGDVISGTSITSLLNTILQDMYSRYTKIYECSTAGDTALKVVALPAGSTIPTDGVIIDLKNDNTASSPYFKYTVTGSSTVNTQLPIVYNNTTGSDLTSIPSGYYKVTPYYSNGSHVQSGWLFTKDNLYTEINTLLKKTSKFDILIVKK